MEDVFRYCLCYFLMCRRGNNNFDICFRRIGPVLFPSKGGKEVVRGGKMVGRVFISRKKRHFLLYK